MSQAMSRSVVPILIVLLLVGLLAWAKPDFRQKLTQYANQTSASARVTFSSITKSLSKTGAQIGAYFHVPAATSTAGKPAANPDAAIQTFFDNLVTQTSQLIDSIIAWFQGLLNMSTPVQNPKATPQ